jgi:cysteinyl-tRNA synthetase
MVWEAAQDSNDALSTHTEDRPQGQEEAPAEVLLLAEERQAARLRMDWAASDSIREKIEARGWSVQDTPEGQKVVRQL